MGTVIRFTHKKCGFEMEFLRGVGFSLFKMQCNARKHMRNGDWGDQWKKLIEQYPEGAATLNKALCYCKKCKKYYTEPRIKFYIPKDGYHYDDLDEEDFVPQYIIVDHYQVLEKETMICPECNSEAVVMENMSKVPCPVCGEFRRGRIVGHWD